MTSLFCYDIVVEKMRRVMTGQTYCIRIRTHLDDHWTSWFDGLDVQPLDNGETMLSGYLHDQAAVFSVLMKIRDLGLNLVAVEPVDPLLDSEE
jgi:hypothetical protein